MKPNLESSNAKLLNIACNCVSPGDNVWDIGANVGVFTFAAANKAGNEGQIVSVEADPFLASLLQRSALISSNSDLNVNVLCAAVSDEFGVARFLIAERGRSSNSLERSGHRSQAGGTRYVQHVPTITLDAMLNTFRPPNFVKIDVEGAEEYVLNGAQKILSDCRPSFYIEVGRKQNDAITSTFKQFDYKLFDGDSDDTTEFDHCSINTLAIPSENVNRTH